MKRCCTCKAEKPREDFQKCAAEKDGLQKRCKSCRAEIQRSDPKRKERAARYRAKNVEACNRRSVRSQQKNKSHYAKRSREWAKNNPEIVKRTRKKAYLKNRATEALRSHARNEILRGAKKLPAAYKAELDGVYEYCKLFFGVEADHIVPLNHPEACGLHFPANVRPLDVFENRSRGNRAVLDDCGWSDPTPPMFMIAGSEIMTIPNPEEVFKP